MAPFALDQHLLQVKPSTRALGKWGWSGHFPLGCFAAPQRFVVQLVAEKSREENGWRSVDAKLRLSRWNLYRVVLNMPLKNPKLFRGYSKMQLSSSCTINGPHHQIVGVQVLQIHHHGSFLVLSRCIVTKRFKRRIGGGEGPQSIAGLGSSNTLVAGMCGSCLVGKYLGFRYAKRAKLWAG